MNAGQDDVFADTVFWVSLVHRNDQWHQAAQAWSQRVTGRIITTDAVITETANALARPLWRTAAVAMIDRLKAREDVEIMQIDSTRWSAAWSLYSARSDKGWSLTDCMSFGVMHTLGLTRALTADAHFVQAGFEALLLQNA
ncbi:MAG: PIN domain-containing protein [Gemmataceae bacterium]|nr:PIN domain-containing protein [Gemmataceae bacterium]